MDNRISEYFTGLLAIIALVTTCALALEGHPVPDIITVVDSAVLGFYFGRANAGNGNSSPIQLIKGDK